MRFTMRTKINPEEIKTVSELIDFLETTNSFCEEGKERAIEFFSEFNDNELIDNIEHIPEEWVVHFCRAIRGKTIDRFRNRIKSSYFAYLWASEFRGKEIDLMRDKVNDYPAYLWACEFGGEEIELMRDKITDAETALAWACKFGGKEVDLMLNKIKDEYYKNKLIELKQDINN